VNRRPSIINLSLFGARVATGKDKITIRFRARPGQSAGPVSEPRILTDQ
jgi:hypothetical protein